MNSREAEWFIDSLLEKWSGGESAASDRQLNKMSSDLWKMTNSLVAEMPFLRQIEREKLADSQRLERLGRTSWFDCSTKEVACDRSPLAVGQSVVKSTSNVPLMTRMGLRTTLMFNFSLLQHSWSTGENCDVAGSLLREWLMIVRGEIENSLDLGDANEPLWVAFFQEICGFLHNLLSSQLCHSCAPPKFMISPADLDSLVQLYLEISLQLGSLSQLLTAALLLLNIDESRSEIAPVENVNLPVVGEFQMRKTSFMAVLKRIQSAFAPLEEMITLEEDSVVSRIYFDFLSLVEAEDDEIVDFNSLASVLLALPIAQSLVAKKTGHVKTPEVDPNTINANGGVIWFKARVEHFDWLYTRSHYVTEIGQVVQLVRSENDIFALTSRGKVFQLASHSDKEPNVSLIGGLEMTHIVQIAAHPGSCRILFLSCDDRVLLLDETDLHLRALHEFTGVPISSVIQSQIYSAALCQSTGEAFLWSKTDLDRLEVVTNVRWISLHNSTLWVIGCDGSVRVTWASPLGQSLQWHRVKELERLNLRKIVVTDHQWCFGVTQDGNLYTWRNQSLEILRCSTDWKLTRLNAAAVEDVIVVGAEFLCYLLVNNGRNVLAVRLKDNDEDFHWETEKFEQLKLSECIKANGISCLIEDHSLNLIVSLKKRFDVGSKKSNLPLDLSMDCVTQLDGLLRFCVNVALNCPDKFELETYENLTTFSLELVKLLFRKSSFKDGETLTVAEEVSFGIRKSLLALAELSDIDDDSKRLELNNSHLSELAVEVIDAGRCWLYSTTGHTWDSLGHFCRAALSTRGESLNTAMVSLLAKTQIEGHLEWLISRAILAEQTSVEIQSASNDGGESKEPADNDVLDTVKMLIKYLTKLQVDKLSSLSSVQHSTTKVVENQTQSVGELVRRLLQLLLTKFQLASNSQLNQHAIGVVISKFWSFLILSCNQICQQAIKTIEIIGDSSKDLRPVAQVLKNDHICLLLSEFCRDLQIISDSLVTSAVFILHSGQFKTLLDSLNELNKLFPMWEKEELEELSPSSRKVADIGAFIRGLKWRNSLACDDQLSWGRKKKLLSEWDVANALQQGCKWIVSEANIYDISVGLSDTARNLLQPFVGSSGAEMVISGKLSKKDRQILQTECHFGRLVNVAGKCHSPYEHISCTPPLLYLEKLICFTAGKLLGSVVGGHSRMETDYEVVPMLAGGIRAKCLSMSSIKSELENQLQSSRLREGKSTRDEAETFLQLLAFGFERSSDKVAGLMQRFQEGKRLMVSLETNTHVDELVRWYLAALLHHTKTGQMALSYAETTDDEIPEALQLVLRSAHDFKWRIIRRKQESGGKSFAEICASPLRRCQFLFTRLYPVANCQWEEAFLQNLMHSDANRWRSTVDKLCKTTTPLAQSRVVSSSNAAIVNDVVPKMITFVLGDTEVDVDKIEKSAEQQLAVVELKTQAYGALLDLVESCQLLSSSRCCFLLGLNGNGTSTDQLIDTSTPLLPTELSLVRFSKKVELAERQRSFLFAIFNQLRLELCQELVSFEIQIPLTVGSLLRLINPSCLPGLIEKGLLAVLQSCLRYFGNLYPSALHDLELMCDARRKVKPSRPKTPKKSAPSPTVFGERSGPSVLPHLRVGMRVERGPHWKWGNQDSRIQDPSKRTELRGRQLGRGTLTSEVGEDGWVRVRWDGGFTNSYRMGKDNKFDLQLVESEAALLNSSTAGPFATDPVSNQLHFDLSKKSQVDRPVVILGSICKAMAYLVCTTAQMETVGSQKRPWRILSSFLLATVDRGASLHPPLAEFQRKVWATPEFVGSILMSSPMVGEILGSKWADSLGRLILSGGEENEPTDSRIAHIRLLGKVLSFADIPAVCERAVDNFLVLAAKLFCPRAGEDHNNDGQERDSLMAEMTGVMKTLFLSPRYNQILNDKFVALVNETFPTDGGSNTPEMADSQSTRSAAMALLIGCLSEKLKVGQRVRNLQFREGEVVELRKETVTIRFDPRSAVDLRTPEQLVFPIDSIIPLETTNITLAKMFPSETAKAAWCQLLSGVFEEISNVRSTLKSPLRRFVLTAWMSVVRCAASDYQFLIDLIKRQPAGAALATSLFQNSLSFAPLKAFYTTGDIELACASLSSRESPLYPMSKSLPDADVLDQTSAFASCSTMSLLPSVPVFNAEGNSSSDNQRDNRAALPTPIGCEGFGLNWDDSDFPRRFWPAATNRRSGRRNRSDLFRFDFVDDSWAADMFNQLKEMGFDERKIRRAIRTQAEGEFRPTVDRMVAWLLENDAETPASPSDFRLDLWLPRFAAELNNSDSAELVNLLNSYRVSELEGARCESSPSPLLLIPPPLLTVASSPSKVFRKRSDFADDHQYAQYVRREISVGCVVRSLNFFEQVKAGDVGRVIRLDKDGLDDLNVQVEWEQRGSIYWVRYSSIEICSEAGSPQPHSEVAAAIRVGDSVRIRPSVLLPKFKWGSVTHDSVGVVRSLSANGTVTVDFPLQSDWTGMTSELELTPMAHKGTKCEGCQSSPVRGTLYICSECQPRKMGFTYCQSCFDTLPPAQHPHQFYMVVRPDSTWKLVDRMRKSSTAVANRCITDWSTCIRATIVSSNTVAASALFDGRPDTFWQSSGKQGGHWILLEVNPEIAIKTLKMHLDPSDQTYLPSLLRIRVGITSDTLKDAKMISVRSGDTTVNLVGSLKETYRFIEIRIVQCQGGGIDCRLRGLSVQGCRVKNAIREKISLARKNFLSIDVPNADFDQMAEEICAKNGGTLWPTPANRRSDVSYRVFVWGLNDKEQLGSTKLSKVKVPILSEILGNLKPRQIAAGSKSLFIVDAEGRVFVCGEAGKQLNLQPTADGTPQLITALRSSIVAKLAVHAGGKHVLALTTDGQVLAWGANECGQLGLGHNSVVNSPQLIESLQEEILTDVACGSSHSAAITADGQLFTWGYGAIGRLGHGDTISHWKPKRVEHLKEEKVVRVACGSRDAQTVCLTEDQKVFTWGDGDFGKLGDGTSQSSFVPLELVCMRDQKIVEVYCGAQFTAALSSRGEIYTWGKGDYFRLGHGTDSHCRQPKKVESLVGHKIVAVAIGALHGLALTDQGQVYAWGDNDHGQLGNNNTTVAREPTLVRGLDESITHVACGSSHSVAWMRSEKDVAPPADPFPFPIPFESATDPLGAAEVGGEKLSSKTHQSDDEVISTTSAKASSCSIAQIVQTFTNDMARSQALTLLMRDLLIRYSRQAVVGMLGDKDVCQMLADAIPTTNLKCDDTHHILPPSQPTEMESVELAVTKDSDENTCEGDEESQMKTTEEIFPILEELCDGVAKLSESATPTVYSNEAKRLCFVRSLIHLLKLMIGGRCSWGQLSGMANSADKILVNLISSFAEQSVKVQKLLLHVCNDHLMRLSDFGASGGLSASLRPVTLETKHPYQDDSELSGHVSMPGATAIRLEFDQRCSTERLHDPLAILDCNGKIICIKSGREGADWSQLVVPGDEFYWRFVSDGSVNGWGWKLTAYPIVASQAGTPWSYESSLADSQVLAHPSFDLVKSLLGTKVSDGQTTLIAINETAELMGTLITNMTGCLQLNVLSTHQQLWVFEYFRQFLPSISKGSLEPNCSGKLRATLIRGLTETLLIRLKKQCDYEEPLVRGGSRLSFSHALKLLASVVSDAQLDDRLETEWRSSGSIKKFCHVTRVVESMAKGTSVPPQFSREVLARLAELSFDHAGCRHDDNGQFGSQADAQLVDWYQRRPADWTGLAADITGTGQTIFGWGHNHRGQLGGAEGAKVKLPVACESLSILRPVALVGGEQTLFAVTADGQVWATGYGAAGRLGIGGGETLTIPTLIESLRRVFITKVAVSSGGRHSLALSDQGEVYSWGEGEDGKLGHGNRLGCEKPKVIESLRGMDIIDVAAGGAHSACITANRELFTWGKGRYGRLGHGDSEDQMWPKLVKSLADYRVIYVACGSGDAQTLCTTDDDCVWSWGDGDYGKLGRGGSDGCKIPMRIDSLQGCGVIKVECGSQFSAALTKDGHVYTWGKGDYYRLGHNSDEHVRRPKLVAGLQGKKIVALACGSLHCLVCTDQGEVYAWGDNDEGQLGDGSVHSVQKPKLITALLNKNVNQVTCGSAHSLAWSTVKPTVTGRLPKEVPVEYDNLQQIPMPVLRNRLILLHLFADLVCGSVAMLDLRVSRLEPLRPVLLTGKKEAIFRKAIQATMIRDRQHGPVLELNRIQRKRHGAAMTATGDFIANLTQTVFGQMSAKVPALLAQEAQLLPQRVWKVKFIGESVDDCGGGYHDSIAEILEELQTAGLLPILTPTADGNETGEAHQSDHAAMVINPQENSKEINEAFRFFGMLLGIAIRTASPLNLSLAEPMWKLLTGWPLQPEDMTEIDKDFIPNLVRICDTDDSLLADLEIPFTVRSVYGREVPLSTSHIHVNFENRFEYRNAALNYKLHEFDTKIQLIREGMATVIPVPLLSLFTPQELETMVCGNPDVPLPLLRSVSVYKGFDQSSTVLVEWFWEVMEEFSGWERSLLLRFVWGRARLPRTVADFRGREFVIQALDKYQPPDHFLPEAYTCFFLLKLPRYSSKVVLRNQLRYAIHHCKSIDSDDYARIAEVPQSVPGVFQRHSGDSDSDADDFPIPSEFLNPEDIFS